MNEAIRLDPQHASALGNRGIAYAAKGVQGRAIADYSEALRIRPHAIDFTNRGNAYKAQSDPDRAIADYTAAIKLDPKSVIAHFNRGLAYDDRQQYDRAIADYSQAIKLDPKYVQAYSRRGYIYLHEKRNPNRAIADFDQVLKLDPNFPDARHNREIAVQLGGNPTPASAPAAGQNRVQGAGFSVVLPAGWSVERTSGKTIFLTGPGGMPSIVLNSADALDWEEFLDPPRDLIGLSTGGHMYWRYSRFSDGNQLAAIVQMSGVSGRGNYLALRSGYTRSPFYRDR